MKALLPAAALSALILLPGCSTVSRVAPAKDAREYVFHLGADKSWKTKILRGERFSVMVMGGKWTIDGWASSSGGEGEGFYAAGSFVNAPVGTLVGSVSSYPTVSAPAERDTRRIFEDGFAAGSRYFSEAPVDGWLYLRCNDTWSLTDNGGELRIKVTIWK